MTKLTATAWRITCQATSLAYRELTPVLLARRWPAAVPFGLSGVNAALFILPTPLSHTTLVLNTVTGLIITAALITLHLHYELHPECGTCHADKVVCWADPPWHRHLTAQRYDDPMPTGTSTPAQIETPPED